MSLARNWYAAVFIVACLLVAFGPWLCAWLEDRADRRDAALWDSLHPGSER